MPLPIPKPGEDRHQFINRFMDDGYARDSYPQQSDRFAFASSRWENCADLAEKVDAERGAVRKADMPASLYVCRSVVNADEIIAWAKRQGFGKTYQAEDMHVTIAYSKAPLDWFELPNDIRSVVVPAGGPRDLALFGPDKNVVALRFKSPSLERRHNEILEHGASWDWPDYRPHITITMDAEGVDVSKIKPFAGDIVLGIETFAEVQEDASATEKIELQGTITKIDKELRVAYGWFSVIEKDGDTVVDLHGDVISEDTLIEAAHKYVMNARAGKLMHKGKNVADVVESMVFTKDVQKALGIDLGMVGWFGAMKVHDEKAWSDIKKGKFKMFSIGGAAIRKPL